MQSGHYLPMTVAPPSQSIVVNLVVDLGRTSKCRGEDRCRTTPEDELRTDWCVYYLYWFLFNKFLIIHTATATGLNRIHTFGLYPSPTYIYSILPSSICLFLLDFVLVLRFSIFPSFSIFLCAARSYHQP